MSVGTTPANVVLVGRGMADKKENGTLVLSDGRLVVRTQEESVHVEARTARVLVPPHTTVEIEIVQYQVRIAAYSGRAEVTWVDVSRTVEISTGMTVTIDQVAPVDPLRQREVLGLFGEQRTVAPSEIPAVERLPASSRARERTNLELQAPSPALDPRADELRAQAGLLGQAVSQLRRDRDPERALASIAQFRAQFPRDSLSQELKRVEVESLLQLERRGAALIALDEMAFTSEDGHGELRLVRGELRATAGRLGEAIGDFDAVLLGDERFAERALYGRASCRTGLHDREAGRKDLEEYLRRFPSGRFVKQVRDALGDSK